MIFAPFLIVLSAWLSRGSESESHAHGKTRIRNPWFAVWFIATVVFNSFGLLPTWLLRGVIRIGTFLLATAMAAPGMTTHLREVREAGPKPLLLGGVIFAWLIVGGAAINWSVLKGFELRCPTATRRWPSRLLKMARKRSVGRMGALRIADYQSIISKGLNDQVIECKRIEATQQIDGFAQLQDEHCRLRKERTAGHLEHGGCSGATAVANSI